MHGCEEDRDRPRKLGPWELRRCPNSILARPDGWRDEVVGLCNDLDSGIPHGWPGQYSAAVVAGVRYLRNERINCQNDIAQRDQRRRDSDAKAQRGRRVGGRR